MSKSFQKRERRPEEKPEFEQYILDLARVTRVTKGGKHLSFRACVILGDRHGRVGFGVAKGKDVQLGVEKAVHQAKKHIIRVPIIRETIPHPVVSKFKAAMVYPAIVFMAMIGVFFILMIFVVPKLAEMYKGLNVPLPMVTQIMISSSDFMVKYKFFILLGMVGLVMLAKSFLNSEEGRVFVNELTFRLPVFGKINKQKELAQFMRTLALLLSAGINIVEALAVVGTVATTKAYKAAAAEAAKQVEKGNPLSQYFKADPLFPPVVGQMAGVGEETGKTDEMLERIATFYDSEVDHLIKGLSAALEPIILVILGSMVGFLIISIITPIYKITSAI